MCININYDKESMHYEDIKLHKNEIFPILSNFRNKIIGILSKDLDNYFPDEDVF